MNGKIILGREDVSSEIIIFGVWYCLYSTMLHLKTDRGSSSNWKEEIINGKGRAMTLNNHNKKMPRIYIFQLKTKNKKKPQHFLHFWEQRTQISTNAKQQHLKSQLKYWWAGWLSRQTNFKKEPYLTEVCGYWELKSNRKKFSRIKCLMLH